MAAAAPPPPPPASVPPRRSLFAVPAPVRSLFELFPLRIYGPEPLPLRGAPDQGSDPRPSLYVFAADDDARAGRPSFNPSCLKWQAVLRIAGVDVRVAPSNNHASPSGALPFLLLPPAEPGTRAPAPLTGERILKYSKEHAADPESLSGPSSPRIEAYQALLTQNIRPAWLHALYLLPANDPLLKTLYLSPSPSPAGALLHHALRAPLRAAATEQILTTTRLAHVDPARLRADLLAALRALSALLAADEWFFAAPRPGLFDAEVFAYTHLVLDPRMRWRDDRLAECLLQFGNLVEHRRRLHERCWGPLDES